MRSAEKTAKRIAMIGHKFIPSRDGGVEVVVSSLAPHLAETGYDVTCYNRTNKQFKKMRKTAPLPREYRGVHLVWTPTRKSSSTISIGSRSNAPSSRCTSHSSLAASFATQRT